MAQSREHTLASSIIERLKEVLDEALINEDYTRIVDAADVAFEGGDEESEELFALVGDGFEDSDPTDDDDDFDDLDEDFDDEEDEDDEDDLSYEEEFDEDDDE